MKTIFVSAGTLLFAATVLGEEVFQPDSATATSEFSGSYDIGNTIDGSGMPSDFTSGDCHSTYVQNNHWTTRANEVVGTMATFTFDSPVTLNTLYLWNHQSNGIASHPYYSITEFDLVFRDSGGNLLHEELGNVPLSGVGIAHTQFFMFPTLSDVATVEFTIVSNIGSEMGHSPNYSGFAEIAFALRDPPIVGDINLDGGVNLLDVSPFVDALTSDCGFQVEADINQDRKVDLLDVGPFVDLISGG